MQNTFLRQLVSKIDWQEIESVYAHLSDLRSRWEPDDYDEFLIDQAITYSTAIEGSWLNPYEVIVLLHDNEWCEKPREHHLMNIDLKKAYTLAQAQAAKGTPVTVQLLQRFNAAVMHSTGSVHNVMAGTFDSSKGEFRLCGVTAGVGGPSYMNFRKVPDRIQELCEDLRTQIPRAFSLQEKYELGFTAHRRLAQTHPWFDGNGRTARLLMNYIEMTFGLFPTCVYVEDRDDYIDALRLAQSEDNPEYFMAIMAFELRRALKQEIRRLEYCQKHQQGWVWI